MIRVLLRFGAFRRLKRAVKKDNLDLTRVKRIFFTHGHPDHMNALPNFMALAPAVPWIHPADELLGASGETSFWWLQLQESLGQEHVLVPVPISWFQWFVRKCMGKFPEFSGFENSPITEITGDRLDMQIIHTPGHSPGHCSFYFPQDQLLICGDILSQIWGKPVLNTATANYDQYEHSLMHLPDLDVITFAKGHGPKIFHGSELFKGLCAETLANLHEAKTQMIKFLNRHGSISLADCHRLFNFHIWFWSEQPMVGLAVLKSLLTQQMVVQKDGRFYLTNV